ncbi:hepatic leukemia factor-like isoform X2 [Diaphorina citri]|uniref:Hepatic leukemia factor-like isoform X2 n=1 Tax=Diaphorina citri TaxID=121845 RepID=A0A3Q0IQR3_DIACI|nr:hepatic leukemia factor-like isoform X2 [Diaphorina citri]XP_026678592.1 hepatic leukemia factor-like isoform X2 [Diaphorina citri]
MFAEINHFRPYGGSSANWPHCHQQWTACGGHYPGPHPNPPPPKRYILAGKTNCKESSDKSKEDSELWSTVEAQAAFLGPNIWDKTLPYDSDLKYVDLDEFLSDNGIPVDGNTSQTSTGGAPTPAANLTGGHTTTTLQNVTSTISGRLSPCGSSQASVMTKRERSPSPSEPMSPLTISPPSPADSTLSFTSSTRDFDPRSRTFSDEELKPQPMVKKSRKQVRGKPKVLVIPFILAVKYFDLT